MQIEELKLSTGVISVDAVSFDGEECNFFKTRGRDIFNLLASQNSVFDFGGNVKGSEFCLFAVLAKFAQSIEAPQTKQIHIIRFFRSFCLHKIDNSLKMTHYVL